MRILLIGLALGAAASGMAGWAANESSSTPRLNDASVVLEYNATLGEAALIVEADAADPLSSLDVRDPAGALLLRTAARPGALPGVGGLRLETSDVELATLLAARPEGDFTFVARTRDGQLALGLASLSHSLPPAPLIHWPAPGASVGADDLTLRWTSGPEVLEHRIGLEQGDTDTMVVRLSGGQSELRVPAGVLRADEAAKFELIAVGRNGNRTAVEVEFLVR